MLAKIKAHRRTKEVIATALEPFNLTLTEWLLLAAVQDAQSKILSSQLAQELQVSAPLVSRFVNQLDNKGYLKSEVSNDDKREKNIQLSPKGSAVLDDSEPAVREALRQWLAPVAHEHVEIYINVLLQIAYKL